jgi:tetratricopeptide (TPR) repeat protein
MPRTHVFTASIVLFALAASVATARADDAQAAQEFRRAELFETAFGDLKRAAESYRAASRAADDVGVRARADLRAGSCLRRLGDLAEAKKLLDPLVVGEGVSDEIRRAAKAELDAASIAAPSAPTPEPGPAADRRELAEKDRKLEEMRSQLDAALKSVRGLEDKTEDLAKRLRQQDDENRKMRAQIAPTSAEEAMRVRVEEQERNRQLAVSYADMARRLHQEGRFGDARDFVNAAIEKDPENAEARALSTLVSAPLGVRERLYDVIRGALALAGEVRGARTAAEIETLVAESRRRQGRQEFAQSVAPLERALSLIETGAPYLHDAAVSRETVLTLLRTAQANGAQRSPIASPPPEDDAESRGLAAVRDLLSSAGSEVVRGLELRFHEVGPALAAAATGLPPAPLDSPPQGWTLSTIDDAIPTPLLVAYLRAADAQSFAAPGARLDAAGATVVALCDASAQTRLFDRVTGLSDVAAPAAELRVAAYRLAPGEFAALLRRRGIRAETIDGGARAATVPAADLDAIAPDLVKRSPAWPSVASLRATPLRPFRMTAGSTKSSLAIDVLPVTKPGAGLGLRVVSEWTPAGRADGARLRQETTAGAALDPGDGLVVFGVADPLAPDRDLVVIARAGAARASATPAAPPEAARGESSSELLLPVALRAMTDVGPEPVVVFGRPVPSREKALAARLRKETRSQSVEVKDDRVRVVGGDEVRAAAGRFLDQIDRMRGVQSFDVGVYAVTQKSEDLLLGAVPKFERRDGDEFARAIVKGADRRLVEQALAAPGGRIPLLSPRVSAPPTGRADAAYVVRSSYRRDFELVPGVEPAWGRCQSDLGDEGVFVALRPFGRRDTGKIDLDVSLRASWIKDKGERKRETPLGVVTSLEPEIATSSGDLSTPLADDELLVLAKMTNPFADGGERTRLVVTIAGAR